jgi:hypothetical protein
VTSEPFLGDWGLALPALAFWHTFNTHRHAHTHADTHTLHTALIVSSELYDSVGLAVRVVCVLFGRISPW